MKELASS